MTQTSPSQSSRRILQHLEIQGIPVARCDDSTRLLRVRVMNALNLLKKDIFGSSDPYCKIYLFKNPHSAGMVCPPTCTKTIKRCLNPVWNEEFIFRVNPHENRLVFELYDANRLTRDDFLGVVSVPLLHSTIATEDSGQQIAPKRCRLRPRSSHSRVRGSIYLYFAYLPVGTNPRLTLASELPLPTGIFQTGSTSSPTPPDPANATSEPTTSRQPTLAELAGAARPESVNRASPVEVPEERELPLEAPDVATVQAEDSLSSVEVVTDPLPPGWEERIDQNNRVYYVDHVNRRTQWDRPSFWLPEGWEQRTDANGRVFYVDHVNRRTTWYHPASSASNRARSSVSHSSNDVRRHSSDADEGRLSGDDSAMEDADSSSGPGNMVNSMGPCGSASPALIVSDNRRSLRRTDAHTGAAHSAPSTPNQEEALAGPSASQTADAQEAFDEAVAARTMYLRRHPVSLEDTMSNPPASDSPNVEQMEVSSPADRGAESPSPSQSQPQQPEQNGQPSELPNEDAAATGSPRPSDAAERESFHLMGPITLPPGEEPLPPGWEMMLTKEGRPLFLNHIKQLTTWNDPRKNHSTLPVNSVLKHDSERHAFKDLGPLPPGWEERVDRKGRIFYIDHNRKTTQWEDPRLKSLGHPALPYSRNFKQKYDYFRSQLRAPRDTQAKLELRVRRSYVLEDSFRLIHAIKKTECLMHNLWIEFIGEKGLDYGGVQREWFFCLSREMFNPYYGLFEYSAADKYTLQINPLSGIANEDHLKYFKFIGRVVGMAIYHGKLIDGFLIRPFYKMMLGRPITLKDMESVDSEYYRSLKYILENDPSILELTFSVDEEHFGENVEVDLVPGGRDRRVNNQNKKEYIEHIINWRFASRIKSQMWAFLDGFKDVIDLKTLKIFDANELELLICGIQDISVADWRSNTLYKGEYHAGHPVVVNFWKAVYTFPNELRSRLLQFVTGTSRVPMNGFAELWGSNGPQKFTIDCWGSVEQLPRAHTCFNRLDLPPYTTFEDLRSKLIIAIENAEGFEGVD